MALDQVLLGILRTPHSGWELKRAFDDVFSHFWAAQISQIYRHLKGLEQRGLLRSWEEPSDKGPPRRMYERTADGLEELRTWLLDGPSIPDVRLHYVAQTCFLHELERREDAVDFFEQLHRETGLRLRLLAAIDAEVRTALASNFDDDDIPFDEVCGQLALLHGLYRTQAVHDWSEAALQVVRKGEPFRIDSVPNLAVSPNQQISETDTSNEKGKRNA